VVDPTGTVTTELLPTLPGHIPLKNFGKPVTAAALTLSELDAVIGRYVVNDYHHRVHPDTGEPPVVRWLAGGWLPRMPQSLDELNLLLLACGSLRCTIAGHRAGVTGVSVPSSSGRPRRCRQPHLSRCAEPQAVTGRGGTAPPGMCHVKFDEEFGRSTVHRRRRQHRIRGPLNTDELMVVGQLT